MINLNNINIKQAFIGVKNVVSMCLGEILVFFHPEKSYLTFEAKEDNCVARFYCNSADSTYFKTIEVSTDEQTWISKTSSNDNSGTILATLNSGEKLYVRGNNQQYGAYVDSTFIANTFHFSQQCYVYGNVMSLINSQSFRTLTTLTGDCNLYGLFWTNVSGIVTSSNVVSHRFKDIALPSMNVNTRSYTNMFRNTGIGRMPKLPATSLGPFCYANMFFDCANLSKVQDELPAITIANYCYSGMFRNCISLTTMPKLPATSINTYCYQYMFAGCTTLENAQLILPSTNLADHCYFHMFEGCSSLKRAPKLPAETTHYYCYSYMFANCTSLKESPDFNSAFGAGNCYSYMFYGCTSLIKGPTRILEGTVQQEGMCCYYMFANCTSLVTAPKILSTKHNQNSYSHMFEGCTSLKNAPDLTSSTHGHQAVYAYMFFGCTSLQKAPKLTINSTSNGGSCSNMFRGCTSLVDINDIHINTGNQESICSSMFNGCTALVSVPKDFLPGKIVAKNAYNSMFQNCSSLIDAPDLPATTIAQACYIYMFNNCVSLKKAPELPATTLVTDCYRQMFDRCSNLIEGPSILPATNLSASCYYVMFRNCKALKKSPIILAKNVSASYCMHMMFNDCSNLEKVECYATTGINTNNSTAAWLYGVSSTGKFYRESSATWPINASGIPSNWAVYDDNCITFRANENNVEISLASISSNQYLEYSTDKSVWTEFGHNGVSTISIANTGDEVYIRGTLSAANTDTDYTQFAFVGNISCRGNINALWDYTNLDTALKAYCGFRLFKNCSTLQSAPLLPSITVSASSYREMFTRCTSLIAAPNLPALTLADNCYMSMFSGCTSLQFIPEILPATSLAQYCYYAMFYGCTSLKRIQNPKYFLPCTNLSGGADRPNVYAKMFYGCTSLENAPELSHVTAAMHWAYWQMFMNCTSLVEPPTQIKAVFNQSCQEMFSGCTSLKKTPILSATTTVDNCYLEMFINCTSLETAPALPATTLSTNCYNRMFKGCSKLKTPMKILPATTAKANCYYEMFNGCSNLEVAPKISATTIADQSCRCMFANCTKLKYPPALPATTFTGQWGYREMFYGCTSLREMPDLPATNLGYGCYCLMFCGCTNLRTAKPLPATTLSVYAYYAMFKNCTNLNHIEIAATDISASNCLLEWVQGVQTTKGTFVKDPNLTIPTGINGIPTNWAVLNNDTANSKSLKFRSGQDGSTIGLEKLSTNQTIYYSTSYNTNDWAQMTTSTIITLNNNEELYIRGNLSANSTTTNNTQFKMTGIIYAEGDLRYLWNSDKNAALKQYCGWELFLNCTALYSAPYLSATSMSIGCYAYMFKGCTNLSVMPLLPATSMVNFCYTQMFQGCTSLTAASDLPATTLATECYKNMFYGCTSLTIPPKIYATGSARNCCQEMFKNCTSLVNPPELLFTNLSSPYATGQFISMFEGCTSLISAPSLKSQKLTNDCYTNMFKGCTHLTDIPLLTITTIAQSCESMFQNCTSLTDISNIKLPSTTAAFCYDSMFKGCTSLKKVPKDFLPATSLTECCYRYMFQNCTNLEETPDLPATTLANTCYYAMFRNCSKLTYAPKLSAKNLITNCYFNMFYGCTNLNHIEMTATDISATDCLTAWMSGVQTGGGTFIKDPSTTISRGINGIPTNWAVVENDRWVKFKSTNNSTISIIQLSSHQTLQYSIDGSSWNIFDTTTTPISLSNNQEVYVRGILSGVNTEQDRTRFAMTGDVKAYGNCNNIWNYTAVDIEQLQLKDYCGRSTFAGCTALKRAPDLPSKKLARYCYFGMFTESGITKCPELPATTLQNYCYAGMFSTCRSFDDAGIELNATIIADGAYFMMFKYCYLRKSPKMFFAKLKQKCYSRMFEYCTYLTETYDELPSTVGQIECYANMYKGCSRLIKAPKIGLVSAQQSCCESMFISCTSLLKVPEIDIRTLSGDYCCRNMFNGCTSISGPVVLKAYKLAKGSYSHMFNQCSNISNITCLAEDISASEGLDHWLNGVAATGTLTKKASLTYPSGISGIPSGWTVENVYDY